MIAQPPILELNDVRFHWSKRASFSLHIPQFELERGETVLLLGESGAGKSTLLSLVCGTVVPQAGSITLAGTDLSRLSGAARDRLRAEQIGVIFQEFNLLPFGSVLDNILLPPRFAPQRHARVTNLREEAMRLCTSLALPEGVLFQKAASLSVGQQQRVAVARALIGAPPIIVADEPTSALDAKNQGVFLDLVFEQIRATDTTFLMVSHDERLADRFDRVVQIAHIVQNAEVAA